MFDIYQPNVDFCIKTQRGRNVLKLHFNEDKEKYKFIISNPPFKPLQEFLERTYNALTDDGVAVYTLVYIENVKLNRDLFGVPVDYKKVSFDQFMDEVIKSKK